MINQQEINDSRRYLVHFASCVSMFENYFKYDGKKKRSRVSSAEGVHTSDQRVQLQSLVSPRRFVRVKFFGTTCSLMLFAPHGPARLGPVRPGPARRGVTATCVWPPRERVYRARAGLRAPIPRDV